MDDKGAINADFSIVDSVEEDNDTEQRRKNDDDLRTQYLRLLDEHPLATKSVTSAIVGAIGGIVAGTTGSLSETTQKGTLQRRVGVQWLDVLIYAMFGAVQGPIGHFWYKWWEQHGPESQSNSMLVDQIMIQPPMILIMYMSLDVVKAGLQEAIPSMHRNIATLAPVVVDSWRFWPVALYISGRIIKKRKNQIAALKFWSLLWAVYISKQRRSSRS